MSLHHTYADLNVYTWPKVLVTMETNFDNTINHYFTVNKNKGNKNNSKPQNIINNND